MDGQINSLVLICKEDGVWDLTPYKAKAAFARALQLERIAGETTPEAEKYLNDAVAALTA